MLCRRLREFPYPGDLAAVAAVVAVVVVVVVGEESSVSVTPSYPR